MAAKIELAGKFVPTRANGTYALPAPETIFFCLHVVRFRVRSRNIRFAYYDRSRFRLIIVVIVIRGEKLRQTA